MVADQAVAAVVVIPDQAEVAQAAAAVVEVAEAVAEIAAAADQTTNEAETIHAILIRFPVKLLHQATTDEVEIKATVATATEVAPAVEVVAIQIAAADKAEVVVVAAVEEVAVVIETAADAITIRTIGLQTTVGRRQNAWGVQSRLETFSSCRNTQIVFACRV